MLQYILVHCSCSDIYEIVSNLIFNHPQLYKNATILQTCETRHIHIPIDCIGPYYNCIFFTYICTYIQRIEYGRYGRFSICNISFFFVQFCLYMISFSCILFYICMYFSIYICMYRFLCYIILLYIFCCYFQLLFTAIYWACLQFCFKIAVSCRIFL